MNLPERGEGQVRIGIAIEVPPPFGPQLQELRISLGDPLGTVIPPHITLLAPTVVDEDVLDDVERHLESVAESAGEFQIHLRGTGTFRPVSDVVFIQVVQGIAECEQIEALVRTGPLTTTPRFNYHPHVTIAHDLSDEQLDAAFEQGSDFDALFPVSHFSFYHHGDDGLWRTRRTFDLRGPAR